MSAASTMIATSGITHGLRLRSGSSWYSWTSASSSSNPSPSPALETVNSSCAGLAGATTVGMALVIAGAESAAEKAWVASSSRFSAWVASSATPAASMPGTASVAVLVSPARRASAALASAVAFSGRSAGFLASMDMISWRTGAGMVSGSGGGASLTWARAMAICDSPVNGRRPARHS